MEAEPQKHTDGCCIVWLEQQCGLTYISAQGYHEKYPSQMEFPLFDWIYWHFPH